jgi:hypothetical protein
MQTNIQRYLIAGQYFYFSLLRLFQALMNQVVLLPDKTSEKIRLVALYHHDKHFVKRLIYPLPWLHL